MSLHRYHGYENEFRNTYFLKLVMEGLKNKLGAATKQADSLTAAQLKDMSKFVNFQDEREFMLWGALILSFRSLLLKSNIFPDSAQELSNHILLCRHVVWTEYGCILNVCSSKTIQSKDRILQIPIVQVQGSPLCAVYYLKESMRKGHVSGDSPLFVCQGKPILYREGLQFIKKLVRCIGLNPDNVGFHSLRRSGALFLNSIGISLPDIKNAGDWRSMAVLTYLISNVDRKVEIDGVAAAELSKV